MEVELSYLTTKQENWARNLIADLWWGFHPVQEVVNVQLSSQEIKRGLKSVSLI